ncbi:hypothetical protein K469DRAFT_683973 [Zopfia rhizophila CBS 207.26]|uniref:F-box domain-containing protein n=1 Tax=Zopfia rhizophila CBS 207.26 TaxID=1314779 RepID=A0A6A6D7K4_9PEZI|nr:hypothetical protein K469DRAFT_683973 [Zopfia rhizophila CBS 207.26]
MSSLTSLPTELIRQICSDTDRGCILTLRLVYTVVAEKVRYPYTKLFSSIKVPFCHLSLKLLESICEVEDIASKVEEVVIGTETLEQFGVASVYYHGSGKDVVPEKKKKKKKKKKYIELVEKDEELEREDWALRVLQEALPLFPKLKTVKLEDLPGFGEGVGKCRTEPLPYKSSLDTEAGPFAVIPREDLFFPRNTRIYIYRTVFTAISTPPNSDLTFDLNMSRFTTDQPSSLDEVGMAFIPGSERRVRGITNLDICLSRCFDSVAAFP